MVYNAIGLLLGVQALLTPITATISQETGYHIRSAEFNPPTSGRSRGLSRITGYGEKKWNIQVR